MLTDVDVVNAGDLRVELEVFGVGNRCAASLATVSANLLPITPLWLGVQHRSEWYRLTESTKEFLFSNWM